MFPKLLIVAVMILHGTSSQQYAAGILPFSFHNLAVIINFSFPHFVNLSDENNLSQKVLEKLLRA